MSPHWTPLLYPRVGPARAPLPAASAAGGLEHVGILLNQASGGTLPSLFLFCEGWGEGLASSAACWPQGGFERRMDSSAAAGGGRGWPACAGHALCPPVEERGWRALFPALVSAGTSLPPSSHPPSALGGLEVTFEQEGLPEWRAAPPHQPGPGRPEGPAGSRIGEGCVAALRSFLTMAVPRLPQLARGPHQRPLLGTQARQVPARRRLQALTSWLAPAGPAAAAGTSLGTA